MAVTVSGSAAASIVSRSSKTASGNAAWPVSRREWQLVNTLSGGVCTRDELDQALAPFWAAEESGLRDSLAHLTARGWINESGDAVTLTEDGTAAHAELSRRINETRGVVLQGLGPEQYGETVRILTVMAGNVEAALAKA